MSKIMNNNAHITGKIASDFAYSHNMFGRRIYHMTVSVIRLSQAVDDISVLVPEFETILDVHRDYTGRTVEIIGEFQSRNYSDGAGRHLQLCIYPDKINFCTEITYVDTNYIYLMGIICKKPIYRQTPRGRSIADLLLAVNRPGGISDYIPCIVWGNNAKWASCLAVGVEVKIEGRVQSREYNKAVTEAESETRVAYEVSVNKIQ